MTRTARNLLATLLACAALSGCFTVRYETRLPEGGPTKKEHARFFLWGLAGHKDVDLDELCPGGAHAWRSRASAGDVVLSLVTFGVYVPRTIEVECAPPPAEGR